MHRFHPVRGFSTPSVYCREMFALVERAAQAIRRELSGISETGLSHTFNLQGEELLDLCMRWRKQSEAPGLVASVVSTCFSSVRLHCGDSSLLDNFRDSVAPISLTAHELTITLDRMQGAEELLKGYSPSVWNAISALLSDIVLAESTQDDEGGIFSFSDDSVPSVIYLDPRCGGNFLPVEDLADSILHEFLHHVLYNLERESGPFLHDHIHPRMPAPWRGGLREAGGFLHGTFVFYHLAQFWRHLAGTNLGASDKFQQNATKFAQRAAYGLSALEQFSLLTPAGSELLRTLRDAAPFPVLPLMAPVV